MREGRNLLVLERLECPHRGRAGENGNTEGERLEEKIGR